MAPVHGAGAGVDAATMADAASTVDGGSTVDGAMEEVVTTEADRPSPGVGDFAVGPAMVSPVEAAALSMAVDGASVVADVASAVVDGASVVATVPSVEVEGASVVVDMPLAEAGTVVAEAEAVMVAGAGRFP